jgi:exopolyphosphatase/guanosine-5'-triphosphate,3'-diphosphate pyrophosphatase
VASAVGTVSRFGRPDKAVATSKTFRSLARAAGAAPSDEGPYVRRTLERDAVADLVSTFAGMGAAERSRLPGVSTKRAPQLLAGAIVADAAMDLFEIDSLDICPWALREGVILRRLDNLPDAGA